MLVQPHQVLPEREGQPPRSEEALWLTAWFGPVQTGSCWLQHHEAAGCVCGWCDTMDNTTTHQEATVPCGRLGFDSRSG
ncbi:hypothetical protein NFI96_025316 [Prochilodus magdalenae]|nr:hypothetical protein NFI96_025316 [Prochilodus magdalenae]